VRWNKEDYQIFGLDLLIFPCQSLSNVLTIK